MTESANSKFNLVPSKRLVCLVAIVLTMLILLSMLFTYFSFESAPSASAPPDDLESFSKDFPQRGKPKPNSTTAAGTRNTEPVEIPIEENP